MTRRSFADSSWQVSLLLRFVRPNRIARSEHSASNDLSPQAAAVTEAGLQPNNGKLFQVAARLTQSDAAQEYFAYREFALHQMIERHSARQQAAARLAGFESDFTFAGERFQRFHLDQRHFAVWAARFAERALLPAVAVADQASAGHAFYF